MYAVPKILVTGFKPFLGADTNPSELLSTELSKNIPGVCSLILPVEFGKAFDLLDSHLQNHHYDHVLMLGLANGRKKIGFEKIGLNWVQTEHQDEAGQMPNPGPLAPELPLALMSPVTIEDYCLTLRTENYAVEISFSAGTFVCNELYFRVLSNFPKLNAVFIHVPSAQEMEMPQQQKIFTRIIELFNRPL